MDYKGYKLYLQNKDGKFEQFTYEMAIETLQNQSRYIDQLRDRIDKAIELNNKIIVSTKEEIKINYNDEIYYIFNTGYTRLLAGWTNAILKGDEDNETNNNN